MGLTSSDGGGRRRLADVGVLVTDGAYQLRQRRVGFLARYRLKVHNGASPRPRSVGETWAAYTSHPESERSL
jgi:hypothetical protein